MRQHQTFGMLVAMLAVVTTAAASAPAATIAYWQFDEGSDGATASSVLTQVNSPALDGTGVSEGSGLPKFSSQVPVNTVVAAGNGVVNASNTGSLRLTNTGLPGNPNSHNASVIQADGSNALMKPASFTVELWVKVNQFANFAGIIGKERVDQTGCSWQIDTDNAGHLRARFDTQTLGTGGSGVTGYNQSFTATDFIINDGQWHHVALTYDQTTKGFVLYADYNVIRTGNTAFNLVYDNDVFEIGHIGGRGFDGWVDEVRLSDTVLLPAQFLVAPEPASLMLLAPAMLMIRRRHR